MEVLHSYFLSLNQEKGKKVILPFGRIFDKTENNLVFYGR